MYVVCILQLLANVWALRAVICWAHLQVLAGVGVRSKAIIKLKSINIYAFGVCESSLYISLPQWRLWFLAIRSDLGCYTLQFPCRYGIIRMAAWSLQWLQSCCFLPNINWVHGWLLECNYTWLLLYHHVAKDFHDVRYIAYCCTKDPGICMEISMMKWLMSQNIRRRITS